MSSIYSHRFLCPLVATIERDLSALKDPKLAEVARASQSLLEDYEKALGIVPPPTRSLRDRFDYVISAATRTVVEALPRPLSTESPEANPPSIGELEAHINSLTAADQPVQQLMILLQLAGRGPQDWKTSRMCTQESSWLLGNTLDVLEEELLGAVERARKGGLPEAFPERLASWENVRGRIDYEYQMVKKFFSLHLEDAQPGTEVGGPIREQISRCAKAAEELQELFESDMKERMAANAKEKTAELKEYIFPPDVHRVFLPDEAKRQRQTLWKAQSPGFICIYHYDSSTENVSIEEISVQPGKWFDFKFKGIKKVIKEHDQIRESSKREPRSIKELLEAAEEFRSGGRDPLGSFVATLYHPAEIRSFALWYLAYCDGANLEIAPELSVDESGKPMARSLDDQVTFLHRNVILYYLGEDVGRIRKQIWESVFFPTRIRHSLKPE